MTTTTPLRFLEAAGGFQRSAVVAAAVELDVFSRIAQGRHEPEALAEACSASVKGMRVLCDALVILHLLEKQGSEYRLTAESALYLDRASSEYLGGCLLFLHSDLMKRSYGNFTEAVRRGGMPEGEGAVEANHPMWVDFARAMMPMMKGTADKLAELAIPAGKTLDIAAGHGLFGIRLLETDANATVTAVDWPNVLELARSNAEAAGVAGRWSARPGSAFDVELGEGYNTVVLSNILHHFPVDECRALLRRVRESMADGGRVYIIELVPNSDRVSPSAPAWFAVMMLATTPAGEAYTLEEYDGMLRECGFTSPSAHAVPGSARHILVSVK